MRQDLHKIASVRTLEICAPRRLNLSRGPLPRNLEDLPNRQSMRSASPHYNSHCRVNNFAPARRWLTAQAGRRWNEVYAELRARFDVRNTTQQLVLDKLLNRVERDVRFDEVGVAWVVSSYGPYRVDGLYVDPRDGFLRNVDLSEGQARRRKFARQAAQAEKTQQCLQVSATLQLRKLQGLWFWVELAEVTLPHVTLIADRLLSNGEVLRGYTRIDYSTVCRDVLTGREFFELPHRWARQELRETYGQGNLYAKRKWQASRQDVRRALQANL